MSQDRLDSLLQKLPRHRAPPGFAPRVVARADELDGRRLRRRWLLWAFAAGAVAMAILLPSVAWWNQRTERQAVEVQILALKQEHQRLRQELETIRERLEAAAPLVVVGGDDSVDYVLDLRRLARAAGSIEGSGAIRTSLPGGVSGGSL